MRYQFYTPPFIKKMIWVFVGCFLLQGLMRVILPSPLPDMDLPPGLASAVKQHMFLEFVGLVPDKAVLGGYIWQFFTYMFFHGNLTHLLFNMLAFWMFGSELFVQWRRRFFLTYFFVCGIGAAMFHVLTVYLFFADTDMTHIPTIGASGAIYGILIAYALYFGNRIILFFFIFPMKARTAVLIIGGVELFYSISQTQDGVAHLAHLGGMLVGYLFLKNRNWWDKLSRKRYQRQRDKLKDKLKVIIDNTDQWDRDGNNPKTFH